MYFGDTPSAINEFKVGVKFLFRKSARKPSRDMRIVVGAKAEDPFDKILRGSLLFACEVRELL